MVGPKDADVWSLIGTVNRQDGISTIELRPLPFRVGRRPALDLTLHAQSVSTEHAEFYVERNTLRIRDLGSRNGTFVNRSRVSDAPVRDGDLVHFADVPFQVVASAPPARPATAVFEGLPRTDPLLDHAAKVQDLLRRGAVRILFQPIVELSTRRTVGYEALGRGDHPGLGESPGELFQAAAALGLEVDLSRLFRRKVVETVAGRPHFSSVCVNTHPAELSRPGLIESLYELPVGAPHVQFTVEVHEAAIVDVAGMVALKSALRERGLKLAYDDFGSGQARLLELGEAPPELLKFDIRFIRGVHDAPVSKRRLLRSLVGIVRDLGAEPVAEGIESAEEAAACIDVGFTRAQGYLFGRPRPADGP